MWLAEDLHIHLIMHIIIWPQLCLTQSRNSSFIHGQLLAEPMTIVQLKPHKLAAVQWITCVILQRYIRRQD